jgi:hypothetical protein
VGTLAAYFAEPTEPGERELRLVETYARQGAEMVERAQLHAEARQLAALERRRGEQLQQLATAALALSAADSLDELLGLLTEAAVEAVGCHQGVGTRLPHGWTDARTHVVLSEKYAAWRDYDVVPQGRGVLEWVVRENRPLRLTGEQLVRHPDWRGLRDAPDHPPLPDYLAALLLGRDGGNLGLVQLSHKIDETRSHPRTRRSSYSSPRWPARRSSGWRRWRASAPPGSRPRRPPGCGWCCPTRRCSSRPASSRTRSAPGSPTSSSRDWRRSPGSRWSRSTAGCAPPWCATPTRR